MKDLQPKCASKAQAKAPLPSPAQGYSVPKSPVHHPSAQCDEIEEPKAPAGQYGLMAQARSENVSDFLVTYA